MIQPKKKKCKGTGKAKGYGCGDKHYPHRYGLCLDCFKDWLFSEDGKETLNKSIIQGKKKSQVEKKKEFKKLKIENKSIASLIQEARAPFQKLIRIRDHGQDCICCDKPLPFNIGDYDGGHFLKAELYTGLIFHPDNVHGQTTHCNKYGHGNETGYSEGLKRRIGIDRYKELHGLKNSLKSFQWSRYKLIELKEYYTKELRLVEKGLKNIEDVDLTIGIIKL
jgi:hypothetical protein